MRSFVLIFLCCCLAFVGTGEAASTMTGPSESIDMATAMDADCAGMAPVATMPVDRSGARSKPDCCKGGSCACATAHVVFASMEPFVLSRPAAGAAYVAASGGDGYASPALARLVRPPIS